MLADEAKYWLDSARAEVGRLPVEFPDGSDCEARTTRVSSALSAEDTQRLLQDVPKVFRTRIDEVLMTALGVTLARWGSSRRVLIDTEGHGRGEVLDDFDLSRTVGVFSALYPVLLEVDPNASPAANRRAASRSSSTA